VVSDRQDYVKYETRTIKNAANSENGFPVYRQGLAGEENGKTVGKPVANKWEGGTIGHQYSMADSMHLSICMRLWATE